MILVPGVKAGIASLLGFAGIKFLVLSVIEYNLITKAISLQFVVTLDEVLYVAFTTDIAKAKLKRTHLQYKQFTHTAWDNWVGGFATLLFAVFWTYISTWGYFGALMNFRSVCSSYFAAFPGEAEFMPPSVKF